jgi:hypothetical protein
MFDLSNFSMVKDIFGIYFWINYNIQILSKGNNLNIIQTSFYIFSILDGKEYIYYIICKYLWDIRLYISCCIRKIQYHIHNLDLFKMNFRYICIYFVLFEDFLYIFCIENCLYNLHN